MSPPAQFIRAKGPDLTGLRPSAIRLRTGVESAKRWAVPLDIDVKIFNDRISCGVLRLTRPRLQRHFANHHVSNERNRRGGNPDGFGSRRPAYSVEGAGAGPRPEETPEAPDCQVLDPFSGRGRA